MLDGTQLTDGDVEGAGLYVCKSFNITFECANSGYTFIAEIQNGSQRLPIFRQQFESASYINPSYVPITVSVNDGIISYTHYSDDMSSSEILTAEIEGIPIFFLGGG